MVELSQDNFQIVNISDHSTEDNDINVVEQQTLDNVDDWHFNNAGFSCLALNIRSINKNWNELQVVLKNQIGKFHILIITEVSVQDINESVLAYYSLDGYRLYHKIRKNKRGGGIFMYVQDNIQVELLEDNFKQFEGINCQLRVCNPNLIPFKFIILAIYRPPKFNKALFVKEIERIIEKHSGENFVVIGDTNLDILKENETIVQNYETILAVNGFYKCISGTTREEILAGNLTQSCIDHIYIRSKLANTINSVVVKTKISDHYLIGACIASEVGRTEEQIINNVINTPKVYYKLNENILKDALKNESWEKLDSLNDSSLIYESILAGFNFCYENSSILQNNRKSSTRVQKPWITDYLKTMCSDRDRAFHRWKKCGVSFKKEYLKTYKEIRRKTRRELDKAEAVYFRKMFVESKGDIKKSWQNINAILGKKKKLSVDQIINTYLGKRHSESYIVDNFQKTFINDVVSVQHKCNIITYPKDREKTKAIQSMYMPVITVLEVSNIITEMDPNKTPGPDGIRTKDLQCINKRISPIIAKLINLSIQEGKVPRGLKVSIVRPVYKKEDHLIFTNYRPISLLNIIEKIMERCISNRLNDYLVKYNIISNKQFGFQKNKSTSDLLEEFSNEINYNLNNNFHSLGLFIDFSKAFDTLCHTKLLQALDNVGVRGPLLKWFVDYLDNRQMQVKINDTLSEVKHVMTGVPQGSILGPLLYLIYVNDMFKSVDNCKILMYADDTVLIASHRDFKSAENILQREFSSVLRWTHDNYLICNAKKTKIIHFCSPLNHEANSKVKVIQHSYECLHKSIVSPCNCISVVGETDTFLYLGILVDRFFSWKPHVDRLCTRLNSAAFCIYKLRSLKLPDYLLRTVYLALVESIIMYGLLTWGSASDFIINKIATTQNRILKLVSPRKNENNQNVNYIYQKLQLLPIQKLYKYRFYLKYFFDDKFKVLKSETTTKARLRNVQPYIVPTFLNKNGKRLLSYTVPHFFNQLPSEIRNLDKFKQIKLKTKYWLLENKS